MTTIKKEFTITGVCLMSGQECTARVCPSDKKGIFFYPDSSDTAIEATLSNVISTTNCTVLGKEGKQVRVVEHFMGACAFQGIDSLNVYLSSSELPILDGSALVWMEKFNETGVTARESAVNFSLKIPLSHSFGNADVTLLPSESLKITYYVNFEHPDLHDTSYNWTIDDSYFEIYEARTFGYLKDLERFQEAGLALGVSIDNTVGLTETGYTTELRSKFEPIKHKILDLIGDLYLSGINPLDLKAHIVAREAGHRIHVEFAKILYNYSEENLCQPLKK